MKPKHFAILSLFTLLGVAACEKAGPPDTPFSMKQPMLDLPHYKEIQRVICSKYNSTKFYCLAEMRDGTSERSCYAAIENGWEYVGPNCAYY